MEPIVNVVLPVFGIILCGYLVGRVGLLGAASSEALNRFVFYVALPVLLFASMAKVAPDRIFNGPFIAAYLGGQAITFAVVLVAASVLFRRRLAECGLAGMAAIFGNTGYMGIPLTLTAFGAEGMTPAVIATVINSAVVIAVVTALVESDLSLGGGPVGVGRDVALALVRSPLLVAPVAGILWSVAGFGLPAPVETFTDILGAAAGPCALFAIGLFLVGKSLRRGAAEVGTLSAIKLVVHPLITWLLAFRWLDMDPLWATVAVVMAALPAGANVFVLAQRYRLFEERASATILVTTVLSVVTLSALFSLWV